MGRKRLYCAFDIDSPIFRIVSFDKLRVCRLEVKNSVLGWAVRVGERRNGMVRQEFIGLVDRAECKLGI